MIFGNINPGFPTNLWNPEPSQNPYDYLRDPATNSVPHRPFGPWDVYPYIPYSYKILVPLTSFGERAFVPEGERVGWDRQLDNLGFVKLPNDVNDFLHVRGMQNEIRFWRQKLTELRQRLKRVWYPNGYLILDAEQAAPADPQQLRFPPKRLDERLADLFGPFRVDDLTSAIIRFYQKRIQRNIQDDWETLLWPSTMVPAPAAAVATSDTLPNSYWGNRLNSQQSPSQWQQYPTQGFSTPAPNYLNPVSSFSNPVPSLSNPFSSFSNPVQGFSNPQPVQGLQGVGSITGSSYLQHPYSNPERGHRQVTFADQGRQWFINQPPPITNTNVPSQNHWQPTPSTPTRHTPVQITPTRSNYTPTPAIATHVNPRREPNRSRRVSFASDILPPGPPPWSAPQPHLKPDFTEEPILSRNRWGAQSQPSSPTTESIPGNLRRASPSATKKTVERFGPKRPIDDLQLTPTFRRLFVGGFIDELYNNTTTGAGSDMDTSYSREDRNYYASLAAQRRVTRPPPPTMPSAPSYTHDFRDNLTFAYQPRSHYLTLKLFELWFRRNLAPLFLWSVVLYNSWLLASHGWDIRYGQYEEITAKAVAAKQALNHGADFSMAALSRRSGKLREEREESPMLSNYELEREREIEWERMAYLLGLVEQERAKLVGLDEEDEEDAENPPLIQRFVDGELVN